MKNCKKIAALITALCMLATMLGSIGVMAADTEANAPLSLSFDSFTTNDEASLSNDDWTVQLRRRTNAFDKTGSDLMTYECAKGVHGKAVDDGAMKLYFKSGTLEANTDPALLPRFTPNAPVYVEKGEYYEVSTDILWEGAGANKQIRAGIPGDDGSLANKGVITYLLNIDANGKVTSPAFRPDNGGAFTKSPGYMAKAGAWYNIRFVVKAGENNPASGLDEDKNYHWIYINGTLVSEGVFTHYDRNKGNQDKITKFRGFSYFWYLINERTLTSKPSADTEIELTNPSITYIDNLSIAKYASFPEMKNTKVMDFNTHTLSTDVAAVKANLVANHGYFGNVGYQNLTGDVYNIVDGVYGKEKGDHSLFMQKGADWAANIDPTQFADYYEAGHHTGGIVDASINTNPGDFYEMEISMAWNGETEVKAVQTFYNIDKPGDGKAGGYLLGVAENGSVVVLGKSAPGAGWLKPNNWYKFNVVIHAGDNTAEDDADKNWYKLYINDKLVQDRTVFVPNARTAVTITKEDGTTTTQTQQVNYNKFRGFKRYWLTLQSNHNVNPSGTASPGAYYDDFKVSYHGTTEPVYTPVALSSDNSVLANYIACDVLGGFTSYIDSRVAGATLTSNDGTIELFDADYNKIDALNGTLNRVKVTKNDGTVLFGTLQNANKVIKNEAFGAAEPGTTANFNYAKKAYTVENYEAGIAGKNADDYALVMRTTDVWQDGKDNLAPFLQITVGSNGNIAGDIVRDVYTVEYSLLVKGEAYATNFLFIPTDTSKGETWYRPITVTPDGTINVRDNSLDSSKRIDAVKTRPGEWVRYAMTVYPQANIIETYINDQLIQTQQMWANGINYAARFKIEHAFSSTGEGDTKSGEFAIDDFRIYRGSRPEMNPVVLETADETMFDVYNDGDIIFMPGEAVYEDLAINVAGYGTAKVMPTVFTDSTMTEVLTSMDDVLEDGNVFMVANDEGTVYEYFYLAEGEPVDFRVSAPTNSNGTDIDWNNPGHRDLRAHFECYNGFPENATVIFAQYTKDGELLATGFAENEYNVANMSGSYSWPVKASSGAVAIDLENVEDYTVKLFVLDGFGSIKPLTDVTVVK